MKLLAWQWSWTTVNCKPQSTSLYLSPPVGPWCTTGLLCLQRVTHSLSIDGCDAMLVCMALLHFVINEGINATIQLSNPVPGPLAYHTAIDHKLVTCLPPLSLRAFRFILIHFSDSSSNLTFPWGGFGRSKESDVLVKYKPPFEKVL